MIPDWARPDWARIPAIPGDVSFGRYENPYADDLAGQWQDYTGAVGAIVGSDPLGGFFGGISARAEANARARAAAAAGDGAPAAARRRQQCGRRGGGATAEDRAMCRSKSSRHRRDDRRADPRLEDVKDLGKSLGESLVGASPRPRRRSPTS